MASLFRCEQFCVAQYPVRSMFDKPQVAFMAGNLLTRSPELEKLSRQSEEVW
jgi:hypothetical protein